MRIRFVPATIAPAGNRLLNTGLGRDIADRSLPRRVRATMSLAAR